MRLNKKIIIAFVIILLVVGALLALYFTNLFHIRNWAFKYIPAPKYSFVDLVDTAPQYFPKSAFEKWEGLTETYKDLREWFSIQLPKGWNISKTNAGNGFYADIADIRYTVFVWSAKPEKENEKQNIFTLDDFVKWRTSAFEKMIMAKKPIKIAGLNTVIVWSKGAPGFKSLIVYMQGKDYRFFESSLRGPEKSVDIYKYPYIYSLNTLREL